MNIAILVYAFPPKWIGGTEVAAYHIAKNLSLRNHQTCVITTSDQGLPNKSKLNGFSVYRIKVPDVKFVHLLLFWLKTYP